MPKAITCNSATGRPDTTSQTPTKQPQTTQPQNNEEAIPSDAAAGEIEEQPNSSPLYFPPSDPFESEAENEGPSASIPNEGPSVSMAVSEPHPTERGSVAAVTSARETKYSGQKKSGSNVTQRQPSRAAPKKQTIATGKRVFAQRKIVKYRLAVDSPGYGDIQIYQSDKFRFYGTVVGKPPNSKLYKVKLDLLPSDCNEILVVRKDITVLAKGEEEPLYDPRHDAMVEECEVVAEKPASKKSRDCIGDSYKSFAELDTDLQAAASHFELKYGEGEEEKVVWKILSEKEQVTVCPMEDAMAEGSADEGSMPLEDELCLVMFLYIFEAHDQDSTSDISS